MRPLRLVPWIGLPLLWGCLQLFTPGEGDPPPKTYRPKGAELFEAFSVLPLSQSGFHREPVHAAKVRGTTPDGSPDSGVSLTGGEVWGSRVVAQVGFRWMGWYGDSVPKAITLIARDRDRRGSALADSEYAWDSVDTKVGNPWVYGKVAYAFRGPAYVSATVGTGEGKAESIRGRVAPEPSWLFDVPMPEAEGDSLLRPFQGDWALAARNTTCGTLFEDSVTYGAGFTVWAGSAALPARALSLSGRVAVAGIPDSAARDTVLFFTEGRFRTREPFLDHGAFHPGGRFNRPISWSGSAETFILTRYEGGTSAACRVEWIFARGATLDRLRGSAPWGP